jgi:hypothetical protein
MQVTNAQGLAKAVAMLEGARASITEQQIRAAAANIDRSFAPGSYALLKLTYVGMDRDADGKQFEVFTATPAAIDSYIAALKAAI